ncbi:MAG: hypothetical protein AMJ95_01990 [Omnitrophica WOR_2 bacterium SM23_72]|nr:MAG: hypothetical protein AMJ95_01990 [Omnitrophica WOR_2 bacterium SM23_72]
MRKIILMLLILNLGFISSGCLAEDSKVSSPKVILLIAEQNIEGPQRAWWASEIDLSATETTIAKRLIEAGYEVLEPSNLAMVIEKNRAFRKVDLSDSDSVELGNLSQADYVVLGKALASSGGNVPQSNFRSCFANLSVRLIRVQDGKVLAYIDATGSSAHTDVITGGREALVKGAEDLATKIIEALKK